MTDAGETPRPYTLVAELTYRCPLACGYCSNPLDLARHADELDTAAWARVFADAAALGVLQANLTGGEPLVRPDLTELVAAAHAQQLYVNLITSGIPVDRARLAALAAAGLDSVQLSIQDVDADGATWIAGRDDLDGKLEAAAAVRALGLPLTLNVVIHRGNIARVAEFVALAERLGAERLELANTQYLGWALANRDALLPARAEIERARGVAAAAADRLRGKLEVLFVRPDYYADRPRACMDGWARRYMVVTPDGIVLPCHQAASIAGLAFESVRARPLAEIWNDSPALRAFRGDAWMPAPCRSCDERHATSAAAAARRSRWSATRRDRSRVRAVAPPRLVRDARAHAPTAARRAAPDPLAPVATTHDAPPSRSRSSPRVRRVEAVRGIGFSVGAGEIFGFLGPNGAGKTTTIKILCTLLQPTSGRARLAGLDVATSPGDVRRRIGVIFQDPALGRSSDRRGEPDAARGGVPRAARRARRPHRRGAALRRPARARPRSDADVLGRHEAAPGDRPRADSPPRDPCSSTSRPPGWIRRRARAPGRCCGRCGATSAPRCS
jgi:pyrroloquinoline quinone biosynthesis protein E